MNEVAQPEQCTVAEGLSHSQLQQVESLVLKKKKNPPNSRRRYCERGGAECTGADVMAGVSGVSWKSRGKNTDVQG